MRNRRYFIVWYTMIFGKYQTKQKNPAFCRKAILNRPDYWILTLFPRATSQVAACRHLATAARVKYPAALQHCKFDTPLLAAGSLIFAKVEVTVQDGAVINIDILEHKNGCGKPAEIVVDRMVEEQKIDVDAV